jgi:hypothetical protein
MAKGADVPASRDGRADVPEQADVDRARTADRPDPWSRAGLKLRLEQLSPGHPSSPRYAGDSGTDPPGRGTDPPGRGPDAPRRDYWTEVPRFLRAWADHVRLWPADQRAAAVDRSQDPAGSWRGDGNQYLSPEQHAQAKDVIAGVQRAENALTEQMTDVARENSCGGWLDGLQFRLKGEERLKEKIATELGITPAMKPEDAIGKVKDVIRYTFCFAPENYSDGYWDVKQSLEAREYQMVYSKNHWHDDPQYKGINSRWVTPDGRQFELQFHTPESFDAKQRVTHGSYERLRNPLTLQDERVELEAFEYEVCSWIAVPAGVQDIPDYRRKSR